MIDSILRHTIPAAMDVLPAEMASVPATAMLLATGLQESRFLERRQLPGGPARGFCQFELAGVEAVLAHPSSAQHTAAALRQLRYPHHIPAAFLHSALEHNDVLACCFARCLLWTHPSKMPSRDDPDRGWRIYTSCWRPGRPAPNTWSGLYLEAWERTTNVGLPTPHELRKA